MSEDDPEPSEEASLSLRELERRHRAEARRAFTPPSPERRYPLARALLEDPERVPYGLELHPAPEVPGTFIPKREARRRSDSLARADQLLGEMAETLLIGGDDRGGQEVRIVLTDEFFRGTELRIVLGGGALSAELSPPDLDTFELLGREADRLREHLEARGLRVSRVEVKRP